jgi:hypothetical protein
MKLFDSLKDAIKKWLSIEQEMHSPIANSVNDTDIMQKYLLYDAWAIGDSTILKNTYKKLPDGYKRSFWKCVPDSEICARHTGIPKIILTSLVDIIAENYDGISFDSSYKLQEDIWKLIETDNNFFDIVVKATRDTLVFGEGAFKLLYNAEISQYPIIQYVPAKKCQIIYQYGRLKEIDFFDSIYYDDKNNMYVLKEYYKKGCIEYKLFNAKEKEVPLDTIPETAGLENVYFTDSTYIAAVPCKIFESDKYEGHGESIFAGGKMDIFDGIDETISQYLQAIRVGGLKAYYPADGFVYDPVSGTRDINSTVFNPILTLENSNPLNGNDKIQIVQGALNSVEYGQTLSQLITLACAGLCSPSTIAIALQNSALISNDSGEAQREKEKQTLYTINKIKNALYNTLPVVIETVLKFYGYLSNEVCEVKAANISVLFSEYANPSVEAQTECIKKATPEVTIMTPEEIVQEKYGYTITDEEKARLIEDLWIINYGVRNSKELLEKVKLESKSFEEIQNKGVLNTNQAQATDNRYAE